MKLPLPEPTRQTLRRRLLVFLLLPLAALLVLGLPFDYRLAVSPAHEAYDYALSESAYELAMRVVVRDGVLRVDLPPDVESLMRADRTDQEFLAVYGPRGRLLAGDADLLPDMMLPESGLRVSDATLRGVRIRKATYRKVTSLGDVTVVFAETLRKRKHAGSRILAAMVLPNVLLVLATLVLVYFGVRRGLAPLNRLGHEIANRPAHDTSPIPKRDTPGEAEPLINAMNGLIADLRAAAAGQQIFLANAAHQLKTPLSGLQTQLELALQELPEEHHSRVVRLHDATVRLGHLTHQLLALARSGPEANIGNERRRIDLADLLRASASSWFDAALAKGIDLGFEPEPALVEGSEWLLRELLANLINNAIQYTPRGGAVTARSGIGEDGRPFVEVEDNGPGIPQYAHERIFERFYRLADGSSTGTGLGLAIVKEVADRHDATISLQSSSEKGGTCIRVSFVPA